MDNGVLLSKIEDVFKSLGFEAITVNSIKYLRYNDCYCKITFLKDWSAFVIESADNLQDAEKGILEDGDLYYADISEKELLDRIKADLKRDYICSKE